MHTICILFAAMSEFAPSKLSRFTTSKVPMTSSADGLFTGSSVGRISIITSALPTAFIEICVISAEVRSVGTS